MILEKDSLPAAQAIPRTNSKRGAPWKVLMASLVVMAAAFFFWQRRSHAHGSLVEPAGELSVVAAAPVTREEIAREIVFESELRPYQEIDVHAKVSGYVQSINVDVGDRVEE